MGRKEKLLEKVKANARNITFAEMETLLGLLGYTRFNKGRTSGSRISFTSENHPPIMLHKPHPRKELLEYQVAQILAMLQQEGLL